MSKDTAARIAMRKHVATAHSYLHLGVKSKEVLEQEIFSLMNRAGFAMTDEQHTKWAMDISDRLTEYSMRFPQRDWSREWAKWAKS